MMSRNDAATIELLTQSYNMEIETVINYLANSVNLDGVRAEEIKTSLAADVLEEIGHAQQLGRRIKQLGGVLPGSASLAPLGKQAQPPPKTTDVVGVIKGVIAAEEAACKLYLRIIGVASTSDPVTADLCTRLLADEEEHLALFRGFLKEYEVDGEHTNSAGTTAAMLRSELDATDAFIPVQPPMSVR